MPEPSPLTSTYHTFSHVPTPPMSTCLLPCPYAFSHVPTPPMSPCLLLCYLCFAWAPVRFFQLVSSCFQPHSRTSSFSVRRPSGSKPLCSQL